ncbi:hypothetical protein [Cryptosporangium minutisporangium]
MTITESRRFLAPGRSPQSGARKLLLGLFGTQRSGVPAAIRPSATVAGPVPPRTEAPGRVICWPLDPVAREHLASRAEKRLVEGAAPDAPAPTESD